MVVPFDVSLNKYSLEYPHEELQRATHNFDEGCRLGNGACGAVYRGTQADGTDVAIKVLDVPADSGFEEEVRVLSKFRHPNLVILMGFARCGPQRFLIYELLGGGDVYKRLQRSNTEGVPFLWRHRVGVAFDAACGLSHLHHATPKAFHRDIKSPNILLDQHGTAKMADFGLSCVSRTNSHKVEKTAGTVGYACPLYIKRGVVTEGSEIYSFGIVMLELLTASPPAWVDQVAEGQSEYKFLVSHIDGDVRIAASLADRLAHWPQEVAQVVAELALVCTNMNEEMRPHFTDVVNVLRPLRDAVEPATPAVASPTGQPAFFLPRPGVPPLSVALPPNVPCVAGHVVGQHSPLAAFVPQVVSPVAQAQHYAAAQPRSALLWVLECTFSDNAGRPLGGPLGSPRDRPAIMHWQEPGGPLASCLAVGSAVQEEFFAAVLPSEDLRSMVAATHFKIWAEEVDARAPSVPPGAGVPCKFFISNHSIYGTMVNGTLLEYSGQYTSLHNGDVLTLGRSVRSAEGATCYAPFLKFRFDLAGSNLRDAMLVQEPAENVAAVLPPVAPALPSPVAAPAAALSDQSSTGATSLAGDVVPLFLLVAGGRAIKEGLLPEHSRVVHGPFSRSSREPFAPLLLGRCRASGFWRRLLHDDAFQMMSRDHLIFEAYAPGPDEEVRVTVRNLSAGSPIRVCTSTDEAAIEGSRKLEMNDRPILRHGDVIVVNPSKAFTFWFTFHLLKAKPSSCGPGLEASTIAPVAWAGGA